MKKNTSDVMIASLIRQPYVCMFFEAFSQEGRGFKDVK